MPNTPVATVSAVRGSMSAGPSEIPSAAEIEIKVLSASDKFRFPFRRVILNANESVAHIGRSSKVPAKGCWPEVKNCWFDSPVMSRKHARLEADLVKKAVYIEDTNSTHGTYLNSQFVKTKQQLSSGDEVRFGIQIDRTKESYPPLLASINVNWLYTSPGGPSGTYRLPDETDNEASDDGEEKENAVVLSSQTSTRANTIVAPTQSSTTMPAQSGSFIDLTVSGELPSEKMPQADVTLDVEQSLDPEMDVPASQPKVTRNSPCYSPASPALSTHDATADENEMASLSEPESEDDASSVQTSEDDLFPAHSGLEEDEEDEGDEEDHYDGFEHYSQHSSEDEEDSEMSDEEEQFESEPDEESIPAPLLADSCAPAIPALHTTLTGVWPASKRTSNVLSPGHVQPNRSASPSDAVMPRAMPKFGVPVSPQAQALGDKAGKPEFFAAREVNRCVIEGRDPPSLFNPQLFNPQISLPPIHDIPQTTSSTHPGWASSNQAFISGPSHFAPAAQAGPGVDSDWSNPWTYNPPMSTAPEPSASTPYQTHGSRTHVGISELVNKTKVAETNDSADAGVAHAPVEMPAPIMSPKSHEPSEDTDASAPVAEAAADGISENSARGSDTEDDHQEPDHEQEPTLPRPSNQLAGSKRRIDDVSEETQGEVEWQAAQVPAEIHSDENLVPSHDSEESHIETVDGTSLPSQSRASDMATKATETEEPPTKRRRRFAEIVGVAAFSALSAGVGVFAALVATAPTFD